LPRALAEPRRDVEGLVKTGRFLGIPYDWRRLTKARLKERWWNPDEPRLFTPKAFGWGWSINLARLFRRQPKSR
jgi:uncharacterized protein DUF5808